MEIKYKIELKEREKIISELEKQINILSLKNNALKYENEDLDIFFAMQNDLLNSDFTNIDAYKKIKELNLFDNEFYISEYNYNLNVDPLLHYIYKGYKENKNPSSSFDGEFYANKYYEIKKYDMNPLVYFVLYGQFEGKTLINSNIKSRSTINKKELTPIINKFDILGVSNQVRIPKIIISLTSFPERIYDIHFCIFSLLNQKFKPDKVVLWLAEEEFPNKENDLTVELLSLKENGLEIKWCENIFSYKKLIPSLRDYPNDIIVTADDDLYYPDNWLSLLYDEYLQNPDCIISHRSRRISVDSNNSFKDYSQWNLLEKGAEPSFLNFSTNGAGTLFPPFSLHNKVLDLNLIKELCPTADDIWFWAMAVKNQTKIKALEENISELTYVNLAREDLILNEKVLWSTNTRGQKNNVQLKNILNRFPEINEIIFDRK